MTIFVETKRLIIKAPELKDIDKIYMLDSDPDVMRYIGNGLPRSKEDSLCWYEKSVRYYQKYGHSFGLVYEKGTGEFVGRAVSVQANTFTRTLTQQLNRYCFKS